MAERAGSVKIAVKDDHNNYIDDDVAITVLLTRGRQGVAEVLPYYEDEVYSSLWIINDGSDGTPPRDTQVYCRNLSDQHVSVYFDYTDASGRQLTSSTTSVNPGCTRTESALATLGG